MRSHRRLSRGLFPLLLGTAALLSGGCESGQTYDVQQPSAPPPETRAAEEDPPGRVLRLSYVSGAVSMRPGGTEEWGEAVLNSPLENGDHLWTDAGSRAEVHAGSTALDLGAETAFGVLDLTDDVLQVKLSEGTLMLRVPELGERDVVEVDTPVAAVTLRQAGLYRIDVPEDGGSATVTVRKGEVDVDADGPAFSVRPGEAALIQSGTYDVRDASGRDDFERWCLERGDREERSASVKYVSREMVGYEDLDANGTWSEEPDYGRVWVPTTVSAGWAPYRYGHWVWLSRWGWTWVDDAPWGFAPFHYGRWAFVRERWAWYPGTFVARPVWAPALVAFVGGGGWSVSVSAGPGIGWFPLGPREVYVPGYRVSPAYVRRVNVTHVAVTNINVTNVTYVNRRAVTVVPTDVFRTARPVGPAHVRVPERQLAEAKVAGFTAPITPTASSLVPRSTRTVAVPRRTSVLTRPVVARSASPPPPVPFTRQEAALSANGGRPLGSAETATLRRSLPPSSSPVRMAPSSRTGASTRRERVTTPRSERPGESPRPRTTDRPPDRASDRPPARERTQAPSPDRPPATSPDRPPASRERAATPHPERATPPPSVDRRGSPPHDVPSTQPDRREAPPPRVEREAPRPSHEAAPRREAPPPQAERPKAREAPKKEKAKPAEKPKAHPKDDKDKKK